MYDTVQNYKTISSKRVVKRGKQIFPEIETYKYPNFIDDPTF